MRAILLFLPALCLSQQVPETITQFGPFRQPPFNARGPGFTLDGPNKYVAIYYNNIPFLGKIPYPTLTALDGFDFGDDGFDGLPEGSLGAIGRAALGFDDPRLNFVPPYYQAVPLPDHVGNDLGGDPNIRRYLAQIDERSRQSHQRRYELQKSIDNPFIPVPDRAEWFDHVSPPPFAGIGKAQRTLRDSAVPEKTAPVIPDWATRAKSLPTHTASTGNDRWWNNSNKRGRRRKRDAVHPAAYSSGDLPVYRHNVLPISRGNTVLALDQNGNLRRGNDFWSLLALSNQNAKFPLDQLGTGSSRIGQGTFGVPVSVGSLDTVAVGPFATAVGSTTNVDTQLFGGKPGQYGRLSALNPIGVGFGNTDVVQFPFGGVRNQNVGYVNIDLPYKQSRPPPSAFPLRNGQPSRSRFPATLPTLDKIANPDPTTTDLDEFTEFVNEQRPNRWKRFAM